MKGNRKQQIIDIADEFLQTRVFSAFSYQDIADKLGITKAAIHSHYRTKEILGNALLEQYLEKTKNFLAEVEREGDDVWGIFDAYAAKLVDAILVEEKSCPITLLQVEHNVIPQSMQKGISKIYSYEKVWMVKLLEQGRDEGVMVFQGDPEDQASLIQAAVMGAFMNARAEGVEVLEKIMGQIKKNMRPE